MFGLQWSEATRRSGSACRASDSDDLYVEVVALKNSSIEAIVARIS